jgi:photosystem II stability/assembly factor-like uncharacterized protein
MPFGFRVRLVCFLALALAASPAFAAPGAATSTGPFLILGDDAHIADIDQLVYPGRDPRFILARTYYDLYASRDGGITWRSLLPHGSPFRPLNVLLDAADPEHFFAYGINPDGRAVLETRDGGRNWAFVATPDPDPPSFLAEFFADAHDARTLVVRREKGFFVEPEHWVSRNGGQTWSALPNPGRDNDLLGVDRGVAYFETKKYSLATGSFTDLPSLHMRSVRWLAFDRVRPNTLFVFDANYNFAKSEDGGLTFTHTLTAGSAAFGFSQSPANPSHLVAHGLRSYLHLSLDRGGSWSSDDIFGNYEATAFDPATGEVVMVGYTLDHPRRFTRRGTDGARRAMPTNALPEANIRMVWARGDQAYALSGNFLARDAEGMWQRRGLVEDGSWRCFNGAALAVSPADPQSMVMACGGDGVFYSRDGGYTWRHAATWPIGYHDFYQPELRIATGAGGTWLYTHFRADLGDGTSLYRSADFGATWEAVGEQLLEVAVHSDAARGVFAIHEDGSLRRYLPASGWQAIPSERNFRRQIFEGWDTALGHDPAHPETIYVVANGSFYRSPDFGATWETRSFFVDAFAGLFTGPVQYNPVSIASHLVIDPFDADHWLMPAEGYETHDGGRTFGLLATRTANSAAAFDPLAPGRFLAGSYGRGVLERTSELPACPGSGKTWCARDGRFQLTVDWQDPLGNRGRAVKVATGSEESGLFYFFDPNNWELLVKVLDGCGINQRFWLLAAGTTDVAYVLQVEDRWTGQIRHYANAAGQASPAVIDTDAFSGCGVAAPPGARPANSAAPSAASLVPEAGGETRLELVGGRFEVETTWTDFAGATGPGRTAPLSSDNSGLFYFFSPDNWEVLVKVLNGCGINGHYWVLAAATTDVGYRLAVKDGESPDRIKTYTNPVGRAAPALLDLAAFACD